MTLRPARLALLAAALAGSAPGPLRADDAPAPAPYVAPPPAGEAQAPDAGATTAVTPPASTAPAQAKTTQAAAPPPLPAAEAIALKATLDRAEVTLGEPFSLEIDVVHPPADAYALPPDLAGQLDKGSLKLRGDPAVRRERVAQGARTVFTLPLVVLASMEPKVPDLALPVQGPDGPRALAVPGQPLAVKSLVQAEGAPNEEHAHHGPKPPVPVTERAWLWAWLLLAIAAVAASVWALRRWRARRAAVVEAVPEEAPESVALRRLDDLKRRCPWTKGEGRAAIFERSEIVRAYLGRRLAFNAVDLTSDELLQALRERRPAGLDLDAFAARVSWEELVKFAKMEPSAAECEQAVEEGCRLVEHLRPPLETARSSPLAAAPPPAAPEARP